MSAPLEPRDLSLPHGLDGPPSAPSTSSATPPVRDAPSPDNAQDSESDGGNVSEGGTAEPFANLKLEREFEDDKRRDQRTAKLVMGPPLGGNESGSAGGAPAGDQVIEGEALAENEEILADLDDDALDLELTHLRLRTLRGLGVERFRKVQRISLRQNLLSTLFYHPLPPPAAGHTLTETATESADVTARDAVDEDPHDDDDAAKKEADFPYHEQQRAEKEEPVWPLRDLKELEELDLYDNSLKSIKGLEGLDSLESLDLSFNLLRSVAAFNDASPSSAYAYPRLTHLYLIQNKLTQIEGVKDRTSLTYLEYGGNRIRTIENLPISSNLRSLFLGKNKITKIENLDGLTGLRTLSIQSNRLTKIEGLDSLTALEELYLSHNGLTKIEGLRNLVNLTTLDVGHNKITDAPAEELAPLSELEEFWANDNLLTTLPSLPASSHPNLSTVYLEGNPLQKEMGTAYRRKVQLEMPQVRQIDATFVRQE
ncbi:leucine-rich repeat domain-containing protein [Rhodotorula paludigena]|uniref:leucine-rich repeat domain-containing protein n=1 Tax=Rhodotorula paludigena TaxID=86838 RepID=UPI0031794037